MRGVVYSETVVHAPPAELLALAPYQVVMVEFAGGGRVTGRVRGGETGERVAIGDEVIEVESEGGVRLFRRAG